MKKALALLLVPLPVMALHVVSDPQAAPPAEQPTQYNIYCPSTSTTAFVSTPVAAGTNQLELNQDLTKVVGANPGVTCSVTATGSLGTVTAAVPFAIPTLLTAPANVKVGP